MRQSGSPDALARRGPLRTGRARFPVYAEFGIDETMPSTGLCRVDIAECMSGLVEAVDVLAGSAYS